MSEKSEVHVKEKRENYKRNCMNFGAIKVKIKRSKFQEIQKVEDTRKSNNKGGEFKEIKANIKEVKNSKELHSGIKKL